MGIIGVGTTLSYEDGSGFTPVPKLRSAAFPKWTTTQVDTTNLDCTDYAKTSEPGMTNPGTVSYECEFSADVYAALSDLVRETIGWRTASPSGSSKTVTCDGYLSDLDVAFSPDELVVITFNVTYTGLPDIT
jgi:hypothetical protein